MIAALLDELAAALGDQAHAIERARDMISDGVGPEEIGAAIIQVALARRMFERALERSGAIMDNLADAAANALDSGR